MHNLCHIHIHKDKMAYTACHDEKVEHFMRAEVFVSGIKERQLQRINDTTGGVDKAPSQQPQEGGSGEGG